MPPNTQAGKANKKKSQICEWCNKLFTNRGNLVNHKRKIHNEFVGKDDHRVKCEVCNYTVRFQYEMKYHIRRSHFNMKTKIPYFHFKRLNQVWFEKLFNTNTVMRMQKLGENVVSIQKLNSSDIVNIHEGFQPELDVSNMYPGSSKNNAKEKCTYCNKLYGVHNLKKHIHERHLNIRDHKCNKCNRAFKRFYQYIKHDCYKMVKEKKQVADLICIDTVV